MMKMDRLVPWGTLRRRIESFYPDVEPDLRALFA